MDFQFDLLTDQTSFLALEPEWNPLLQESAANNIFLTWEWVSTWQQAFTAEHTLWLVTVRQSNNGHLVGIAPFVVQNKVQSGVLPYRELTFLGSNQAAPDHLDFIVRQGMETAVSPALAAYVWNRRDQWDVLHLNSAVATGTALEQFQHLAPSRWQQSEKQVCPYTPLPTDWAMFEKQLGKNMRRNIKRYDRQLTALGDARYSQLKDPADLPNGLASLRRLHKMTRQDEDVTQAYWNDNIIAFQEALSSKLLANGWLRLYRLHMGDDDIGIFYSFYYHNKLYCYMTGYDMEWSRYGPGRQMIVHAIRSIIGEGAKEIDFLRGEEAYKFEWLAQPRYAVNLKIATSNKTKLLMQARQMKANIRG